MTTVVDWSKIRVFQGSKNRAFEELCCQLFELEFSKEGKYTRIDDVGGGGGIEAYIIKSDDSEIGVQAKYFLGRLSEGNRKDQIIDSIESTLRNRPHIKKLIFCLPINLTDKVEGRGKSEREWWSEQQQKYEDTIELILWDSDKLHRLLIDFKNRGKLLYWFGKLELSPDWFKRQFENQIANIGKKYLPGLHVEGNVDFKIHCLSGDEVFLGELEYTKNRMLDYIYEIKDRLREFRTGQLTTDHKKILSKLEESVNGTFKKVEEPIKEIDEFINLVSNANFEESFRFNFSDVFSSEINALSSMIEFISDTWRKNNEEFLPEEGVFHEGTLGIIGLLSFVLYEWEKIKDLVSLFRQNELIIIGEAGKGKTHIVCSFADRRTGNGEPAILLLGINFNRNQEITAQIRELLKISSDYSWDDLVMTLEIAAKTYKSKLLFIIDGINESEDIGIWQKQLSGMFQSLRKSPWIVSIVTCRTTYVPVFWGDEEVQSKETVYGFPDINEALEKYFTYFKITPRFTFSFYEVFRHPLYLRILCDTYGDPSRKEPAIVDIRKQNLYKVFDDYIRKCNRKIFLEFRKVDDDPNINHVQKALLSFGREIWNSGKRFVPKSRAREIIDSNRPWSGNLFRAILEENLLISRDFISYENEEVVDFTYDLLGDYVIAQSLLEAKTPHEIIVSLQSSRELSSLIGQNRHPRLEGILRCLAVLLPEKTGKHLYCILQDFLPAQIASEEALFEMDPEFIDKEAKDWLFERFRSRNSSGKRKILSQLINTSYVPDHPLDFLYIDQLLYTLSMSQRDLVWTEYIRENDEFMRDITIGFENKCMKGEMNSDEQEFVIQEARLLRWILTSTNRGLRDIATRALYWFGRRFPERLFELTEESFAINDSYVPERMLAAAYGVAMAYPSEDSMRDFAVKIYDNFFGENAPYATTHLLMRDYARHFIELVLNKDSTFFTDHQEERIIPPFKDGGVRNWGEDQDAREELMKSSRDWGYGPIRMDFAEYIIGGLIKWINPGENFPRLAESISRVIWRMKELGYSESEFGEIDMNIMRYYPNPMIEAEATGRVERYGKKYSWIAYFELAGFYSDSYGDQEYWRNLQIRSAYADIDPSFPEIPQELEVIKTDYLGDRTIKVQEWIENGGTPTITDYLIMEELCGEKGPWVLLDGSINQEDLQAERFIFIYPRGLIIEKRNVKKVVGHLGEQDLGGRCPPQIPEDYYTFAGEIPWCETFPYNGESTIEFVTEAKNEKISTRDVLIPVRTFSWEPYHSITNPGQLAYVPAKELAERLDLQSHPQTFDLYDSENRRASITLKWGKLWHTEHRLIYLREDILEKFLRDTNQELVWAIWGERRFVSEDNMEFEEFSRKFQHGIKHQNVLVYSEIKP